MTKPQIPLSLQKLNPKTFNPEKRAWTKSIDGVNDIKTRKLTLVTYNIWFSDYYRQQRHEAILKLIQDCDADAIALQEVTPTSLKLILKQDWVRNNYYLSDTTGKTVNPYGVLLLSKLPIHRLFFCDLISQMSRKFLCAQLQINGQHFNIATVHLESKKKFASIRAIQLADIFPLLEHADHAVLMGDFNFCSSWENENRNLDPRYQDMWAVLRGDEPGYTEDTDINLMRLQQKQKHKKVRFDRILLHSDSPGWQPQSIERLGLTPLSPDCPSVFPSDHFGLVGHLEYKD
ncbi:MAG: endonuclease/exonuclease/phosphatase family protein [Coleofasciculus sp. G1-WW12-02]|uniref:endonuclease/exonuclease/phosphatase family protein n=1 Tax=Coleofasciculus sp. G1-WW12-02 TaxID=3068483 RepID=UPI0033021409